MIMTMQKKVTALGFNDMTMTQVIMNRVFCAVVQRKTLLDLLSAVIHILANMITLALPGLIFSLEYSSYHRTVGYTDQSSHTVKVQYFPAAARQKQRDESGVDCFVCQEN